ncbi:hypothetical protein GCM10009672_24730 [Nesterenkonia lutea]
MDRLIQELRSDEFTQSHPVLQASYAHYAYVSVHPFPDGNGRVARALASIYLYRRPGIPLVIFADQRARYFEALESADRSDYAGFINFIEACAVDTLGVITAQMHPSAPSASASLADLANYYASTSSELVYFSAAERLAKLAMSEFDRHIGELPIPPQIRCRTMGTGSRPRKKPGYKPGGE